MSATLRRNLLVLALLALATQVLIVGMEKLFLVQDTAILVAYQQALPQGEEQAIAAATQRTGKTGVEVITALYMHPAYGSVLALLLGCIAGAYLVWRRQVAWWVPMLLLPSTVVLNWTGTCAMLKAGLFSLLNQTVLHISLRALFLLIGLAGIAGFFLLLTLIVRYLLPATGRKLPSA